MKVAWCVMHLPPSSLMMLAIFLASGSVQPASRKTYWSCLDDDGGGGEVLLAVGAAALVDAAVSSSSSESTRSTTWGAAEAMVTDHVDVTRPTCNIDAK